MGLPFAIARDSTRELAQIVRPARRQRPSEAAALYLRDEAGAWSAEKTPYTLEPLDALGDRRYRGIIFVGPSRTGKTFSLIVGGVTYIVKVSPGDLQIGQMSKDTARTFSMLDLAKAFRHSPELRAELSGRSRQDNTFDKAFRSGMTVLISWPASTQLASKTLKYFFQTDYDRIAGIDDVGGEGPLFDQAWKRVETFMSRGKVLAESSPGRDVLDAQYELDHPHQAPPTTGILSLYNRGTMAQWYWPCLKCGEYMRVIPGAEQFGLPEVEELIEELPGRDLMALAADFARIVCPHCHEVHRMMQRSEMQRRATWVHAGQHADGSGRVIGDCINSNIVSYWLGGAAAAYQRWDAMVLEYLQAVVHYARTGDEGSMRAKVNTNFAGAYVPMRVRDLRDAGELEQRAEDWPEGMVPEGVRFLMASIDVQAGKAKRFVIQVIGVGVGLEKWIIDRYALKSSRRDDGKGGFLPIDPAAYSEDWHRLIEKVIDRRYPLADGSGRTMPMRFVLNDSGGEDGVTKRALEFARHLRSVGKHRRYRLVKGGSSKDAKALAVKETWPNTSGRKDRHSGSAGDVPQLLLNTDVLKDGVWADLQREASGPGYYHFPKFLPRHVFDELYAETRDEQGHWASNDSPNETLDLCCYVDAGLQYLKADRIDWSKPPSWAAPWDENPEIIVGDTTPPAPPTRRTRPRIVRSKYLSR